MREKTAKHALVSNKRLIIPKALLKFYYLHDRKTISEIARIFHCSADTISKRLDEYSIPKHIRKKKVRIEEVLSMYGQNGFTMKEIGEKFNCSRTTIRNRLLEGGYPVRKAYRKRISEPDIIELYCKGNSINEIAEKLAISKFRVKRCLVNNSVKIRYSCQQKKLPILEILYLYMSLENSIADIAAIYEVAPQTIANRIRYAGQKIYGNKLRVSDEEIYKVYDKTQSIAETARYFDCAYDTIKIRIDGEELG